MNCSKLPILTEFLCKSKLFMDKIFLTMLYLLCIKIYRGLYGKRNKHKI